MAQQPREPSLGFGLSKGLHSFSRQMGPFMSFIYIHHQPEGSTQLERRLIGKSWISGKSSTEILSEMWWGGFLCQLKMAIFSWYPPPQLLQKILWNVILQTQRTIVFFPLDFLYREKSKSKRKQLFLGAWD